MPGPDTTAAAALSSAVLTPCWVGWLDFDGDPVRVTTAPYPVTFSGTGDVELDGFTFDAMPAEFIDVSQVHHRDQGSETVTASMSGLAGLNSDLLNILGNPALWRGRDAALWVMLYDASLNRIGNVWRYYTGVMVKAPISGNPESQTITIEIESYLASLSEPSNRTYLDQSYFDPGDDSAAAAIAIANGTSGNGLTTPAGLAGGGNFFRDVQNYRAL